MNNIEKHIKLMQDKPYEPDSYPYELSICMIVKNESKNLDRCLKSLNPIIDSNIAELIVVDTGSTDNTIEIAKKYTDKVYTHHWQDDFSESRNYSMSFAKGRYIFIIDADEEFKQEDMNKLINEIKSADFNLYNTMTFKIINYTDKDLTQYAVLTQPLIFKNDGTFYYSGPIHNQPVFCLPVKNFDIAIQHYGYIMTEDIKEKKFQRTSSILIRELVKNPGDIYYRFQLSASYSMHGDDEEALKQVELYLKEIRKQGIFGEDYLLHYNNAASIYLSNGFYDEALEICNEALKVNQDFIDFIYYKAFIFFKRENNEEALIYIKKYLDIIDNFSNLEIANDERYYFYSLSYKDDILRMLILLNHRLGKYQSCIEDINVIKDDRYLKSCLHAFVEACIKTSVYNELVNFYFTRISKSNQKDLNDIFIFFIAYYISECSYAEQKKCIDVFGRENVDKKIIEQLNHRNKDECYLNDVLNLVQKYSIDSMEMNNAVNILSKVTSYYDNYCISQTSSIDEIKALKNYAQFILNRTSKLLYYEKFTAESLINIFNKYIILCTTLINLNRKDLLEAREKNFFVRILNAFNEINKGDYENASDIFRKSAIVYPEMKDLIELVIMVVIPTA